MNIEETREAAFGWLRGAPRSISGVEPKSTAFTECVEKHFEELLTGGKCLVMCGGVGSGKTFAAYYAVAWSSAVGMGGLVKSSRELAKLAIHQKEYFEELIHSRDLLIIDDVGAEHKSTSGWAESVFEDLINYRELHRLPTIITTNLTKEDFGKAFGERVLSRIAGWGWYLQLTKETAPDLRIQGKE